MAQIPRSSRPGSPTSTHGAATSPNTRASGNGAYPSRALQGWVAPARQIIKASATCEVHPSLTEVLRGSCRARHTNRATFSSDRSPTTAKPRWRQGSSPHARMTLPRENTGHPTLRKAFGRYPLRCKRNPLFVAIFQHDNTKDQKK